MPKSRIFAVALATLLLALPFARSQSEASEALHYNVDWLEPEPGMVLEVGGMDFLPDGRLVVSTRRGQVWMVENPAAQDPKDARFHLFAEGLYEGLGLRVVGSRIFVLQRHELSELIDEDGDSRADRRERVSAAWGLSGNYHEFAFGLPRDPAGNWYVSLNLGFFDPKWWHGRAKAQDRGCILKLDPEGRATRIGFGFRSPNGIELSPAGDLFVSDNQGDWMPVCGVFEVSPGSFAGHPASLPFAPNWPDPKIEPSETEPPKRERDPAVAWLPYGLSRSAAGMAFDTTNGKFGPFQGQLYVAELTNGLIARVHLDRVRGRWQGTSFRVVGGVGAANRLLFGPDGTLFVGLTSRGWGGAGREHGIARVRYRGPLPFEIAEVSAHAGALDLRFTQPLAEGEIKTSEIALSTYDYNSWWSYGSPETNVQEGNITDVRRSKDGTRLRIHSEAIRPGFMARLRLSGLTSESGAKLLHPECDVTINEVPEGEPATKRIANVVPPPPTREQEAEGWCYLQPLDPKAAWEGTGWSLVDIFVEDAQGSKFRTTPGYEAYANQVGAGEPPATPLRLRFPHEDGELSLQVMVGRGTRASLWLQERYAIALSDPGDQATEGGAFPQLGTVLGPTREGDKKPKDPVTKKPGEWQDLRLKFRAARLDAGGARLSSPSLEWVSLNGRRIHEALVLSGDSEGGTVEAKAQGALSIDVKEGFFAFRMMRFRPVPAGQAVSEPLHRVDLETWTKAEGTQVETREGVVALVKGSLQSPTPFNSGCVRLKVRVLDGGLASLRLGGLQFPINCNHRDSERTGSIRGEASVLTNLVPPSTWCELVIRCRQEGAGVRVQTFVNGLSVADVVKEGEPLRPMPLQLVAEDGAEVHVQWLELAPL